MQYTPYERYSYYIQPLLLRNSPSTEVSITITDTHNLKKGEGALMRGALDEVSNPWMRSATPG